MLLTMIGVFGVALLVALFCTAIFCFRQWAKRREKAERESYEQAIRQHEKQVWAIKNEPKTSERTVISESDRHNNLVKVQSQSALSSKQLRPLSPSNDKSTVSS